jgi:hypothetical protein
MLPSDQGVDGKLCLRSCARGWTVSVRMPSEVVIFLKVLPTPLRSSLVPTEETKNALARGLGQRRSRSSA